MPITWAADERNRPPPSRLRLMSSLMRASQAPFTSPCSAAMRICFCLAKA